MNIVSSQILQYCIVIPLPKLDIRNVLSITKARLVIDVEPVSLSLNLCQTLLDILVHETPESVTSIGVSGMPCFGR